MSGAFLYLANAFTDDADVPAAGAMLVVPTTSLANSAGFSTITTHGLGIAILLILLYPIRAAHRRGDRRPAKPHAEAANPHVTASQRLR